MIFAFIIYCQADNRNVLFFIKLIGKITAGISKNTVTHKNLLGKVFANAMDIFYGHKAGIATHFPEKAYISGSGAVE
jgi:hypothetical protein